MYLVLSTRKMELENIRDCLCQQEIIRNYYGGKSNQLLAILSENVEDLKYE